MISRLGKLQTTRNLVWSKVFIPLDIQISKINSSIYCYYLWTEIVLCMPLSKAKQMKILIACPNAPKQNQLFIRCMI